MGKTPVNRFEDLQCYQKSFELHLEIHDLTLSFPKFEMYELGSQLRRSSNSIPANIAEGWNNKHLNIYLEGLNRALGELRETQHHLHVACKKGDITQERLEALLARFNECGRMMKGLERALENKKR